MGQAVIGQLNSIPELFISIFIDLCVMEIKNFLDDSSNQIKLFQLKGKQEFPDQDWWLNFLFNKYHTLTWFFSLQQIFLPL